MGSLFSTWDQSSFMHKKACIEACRAIDGALYAIHTTHGHWLNKCDCANKDHINTFGGIKQHEDECPGYGHWVGNLKHENETINAIFKGLGDQQV